LPPTRATREREPLRLEAALSGIVALLADERERSTEAGDLKTEVLLARAGLTNEEIASLLGKQAEAVRKAVERARKKA
jgi:DNA-directed RNA polymerase specialized sigma24 family protein